VHNLPLSIINVRNAGRMASRHDDIECGLFCLIQFFPFLRHPHSNPARNNGQCKKSSPPNSPSSLLTRAAPNQKAAKTLAARNSARLTQTHLITLALHTIFLLLRLLLFRVSFTKTSALLYVLLSAPALAIEFWLEKVARPRYTQQPTARSASSVGELRSAGEDLDAKGLMEYLWDVVYWTWACLVFGSVFGDRMWWFYVSFYVLFGRNLFGTRLDFCFNGA
jgi:hypothetical protein